MTNQTIKRLLFLVLLVTSTMVHSEWKYVTSTKDKEIDFYIDFDTLKRKNNLVTVWVKTEFKTTQRDSILDIFNGYLSSRTYEQWDCEDKTMRTMSFDYFSKNDLEGKIVNSGTMLMTIPESIRPDTSGSRLFKVICKK